MNITHATVAPGSDSGDGLISKNAWDEDHAFTEAGYISVGWDGGGMEITAGTYQDVMVPHPGTITGWTLTADQNAAAVVDIWLEQYADFPPTVADTITASDKPTLSSQSKNTSTALTGWTTTFAAGDILRFNLDSIATAKKLLLVVAYTRTA